MLVAVALVALLVAITWGAGAAASSFLLRGESRALARAAAPLLGLAVLMGWLDLIGYVFPIGRIAWSVPLVAVASTAYAIHRLVRSGSRVRWASVLDLGLPTIFAAALGLVPIFVAGRLTVSALTNDDAIYYVSAADQLRVLAWHVRVEDGAHCLSERLVHAWYWRTGLPNLLSTIVTCTGLSATAALGALTAVVFACIPSGAVAFVLALGAPSTRRVRLVVGFVAPMAASAIFLGFQHLLGQLVSGVLFPFACACAVSAVARGGVRRVLLAATMLGGALTAFADGAALLVLGVVVALFVRGVPIGRRVGRVAYVSLASAVLFAPAVSRALLAVFDTLRFRVAVARPIFVQRGWLDRSPLDDLSTVAGVDPWPPWPSPAPPTIAGIFSWIGAVAAIALVVVAARALPRHRPAMIYGVVLIVAAFAIEVTSSSRYFIGKSLLTSALFVTPLVALGVARLRRPGLLVVALPYAIALSLADATMFVPAAFHVVDRPAHDRLVPELAALPRGALVAFDGLGAPTDDAHDEHRAYRAALLSELQPIQPGQDGGFYRPWCREPPPIVSPPPRAWALQRLTSETISRGREVARFEPFALLEADLAAPDALVGSFAPTLGWLGAEREPDGTVFRWGARDAVAALRVVGGARCMRLSFEARTISTTGTLSVAIGESSLVKQPLSPTWAPTSSRSSRSFDATREQSLSFVALLDAPPSDPLHAFALRKVQVEPSPSCLDSLERVGRPTVAGDTALPESLVDARDYVVTGAVGAPCVTARATIEHATAGTLGVRVSGVERFVVVETANASITSFPFDPRAVHDLTLLRAPRDVSAPPWTITGLSLEPTTCP